MSDRPSDNLGGRDIGLARQIDEICRRFEAAWRAGCQPRIDDYLVEVVYEGRPALLAELEALERDLRPAEENRPRPDASSATTPEPLPARPFSTVAEAPTIAPGMPPTTALPVAATAAIHDDATLPPRDDATIDHLAGDLAQPDGAAPVRIRYFGDYDLIRELARGGMGVVFFARQISLNRPVALKMILAGQLANETDVKRFYTEAEAAANLDHPGIVPIYEVGQHEGQHYFSMGYVEGQSLAQRLADGPLPSREAAALMVEVADAIEYAHSRGVIHRDLKPGNILLDRNGHPRVTDFGLAKKLQSDSGLTGSGQIMGTPSYMPPEQAGGKRGEVGPAADVYALGATLYALVTGRPPFQAATAMDTVLQVLSDEPVPPRRLNASVPLDLETICLKCLEKEPGKRYSSAAALAEDLRRYLAGEPIVARPVTRLERAVKWARRRPVIAALSAAVVVIALLGLSGILWQWHEAVLARGVAERESERATAQTELAQRRLYDVQMNVVQRNWEDYNGALLQQGLLDQLPVNQGGIDRRGFEWFYWQRKMASGHITLKGHTKPVCSVAFSPDGSRIVTGSFDDTAKVWDARNGAEALTFEGHAGDVFSAAFSPDGSCIVTGGFDRTVKVWDAGTGQVIRTLKGHSSGVSSVTFSPDGQRLASASNDGMVKVWDARTGQMIRTLTAGHTFWAISVAFSPNGHHLASGGGELNKPGEMKLWDARTGQETLTFKGHTGVVTSVAFSPDGQRLASASWDGTVKVWQVATGQEIRALKGHTGQVAGVAFSPDGRRLASAGIDQTVKVWDAATGQEIQTLKGHTGQVAGVAFSPDGRRLASAGLDQTVKVWDAATGQEPLAPKRQTTDVRGVALSPDGQRLASGTADGTVRLWDGVTGRETFTLKGHTGKVFGVAFSPDGRRLASADQNGTVKLWDARTGQETLTFKGHTGPATSVAFSPDGQRLASDVGKGTVKVWDATTGQEIQTLKGSCLNLAFSRDGQRLASAGGDGTVRVWEATTGQEIRTLRGHIGAVPTDVAFSPDGQRLASANSDGTVRVWDCATGQEALTLKAHASVVTSMIVSVVFSPDGQRLASAGADGTVKLWDVVTGQETLTLKGHSGYVVDVAFSRDGQRLASAGADETVKVWDARPLDGEPARIGAASRRANAKDLAMAPRDIVYSVTMSLVALGWIALLALAAVLRLRAGPILFRLGIASRVLLTDRGQGRATRALLWISFVFMCMFSLFLIVLGVVGQIIVGRLEPLLTPFLAPCFCVFFLSSLLQQRNRTRRLVFASGLLLLLVGAALLAGGLQIIKFADVSVHPWDRVLLIVYSMICCGMAAAMLQESVTGTRVRECGIECGSPMFWTTQPWSRIIVKDWQTCEGGFMLHLTSRAPRLFGMRAVPDSQIFVPVPASARPELEAFLAERITPARSQREGAEGLGAKATP